MRPLTVLALCATLAAALPSCHARPRQRAARPLPDAPILVVVDNRNWQDIVLYAVCDGTRARLGLVTAVSTQTFALPDGLRTLGGELYLIADPVGRAEQSGRQLTRFTSERVQVQPGQRIEWTLQSALERSSMLVR